MLHASHVRAINVVNVLVERRPYRVLRTMTGTQSRIAELAAQVAQHTQRIDDYLNQNGLPHPSFHAESPSDLGLQPDIEHSRTVVLRASQELNDLLQHPRDLLFNHHVRIYAIRV